MPPKKGKRASLSDWSWVGSEARTPHDITPLHRRRAAGLVGGQPCPYRLELQKTDESIKVVKDSTCTAKRCKGFARCYNHIGVEQVLDASERTRWVDEHLGEVQEKRDGPAGLRNLGATCYANAFLQVWYHNVAFRNGVYACLSSDASAMFNLALVFASLQYTERRVVDTQGLVDALRLEKGNQQDAAEFSKLFMSLIESEFTKQQDPALKSLVKRLFEGKLEYVMRCEGCGYEGRSQASFLELELNLKTGSTLRQCLDRLCSTERLDGDNQYHCPRCDRRCDATRSTHLLALPPVIHFALMRFVFDPSSLSRKKSKAQISYPRQLDLLGTTYDLRAVVAHEGTSAYHGHFVCAVYDEAEQEWYDCNDELVTKQSDRPKKKIRLDPDDESQGSKDAYMLVYQRRDHVAHPIEPRDNVRARVEADNAAVRADMEGRAKRRAALEWQYDSVKEIKMGVLRVLPGDECIVPRDELEKWIRAPSLADMKRTFDFSALVCSHGGISPDKTEHARTISREALVALRETATVDSLEVCPVCVEEGFAKRLASSDLSSKVAEFDALNALDGGAGERWIVQRRWVDEWRKGLAVEGLPTDGLFCEHDKPWIPQTRKTVSISPEALVLLRSIHGDFPAFVEDAPPCEVCAKGVEEGQEARLAWREESRVDREIKKFVDIRPAPFNMDFFVLPDAFYVPWNEYTLRPSPRPTTLDMGLCEHGKIDFDPAREIFHYASEKGWEMVTQRYGAQKPIVLQFGSDPVERGMRSIKSVEPGVCEVCRRKRLGTFEATKIVVRLEKEGDKARLRAGRGKEVTVEVRKATSVKEIKVEVMNATGLLPLLQRLYYDGRELEAEDTVGGIGILAGDSLRCVELEEKGEFGEDVPTRRAEGFGGTALSNPVKCGACTYDNYGGGAQCAMCESAL